LVEDALALQSAGAFAIVLELVPAPLAEAVTSRLAIPTIGIGAGAGCAGQVQVWHDLLGLGDSEPPRHAKPFAALGEMIDAALRAYVEDVTQARFPTDAQSSTMEPAVLAEALKGLA
jgi:3-methyl-2-oxobutanoate hydroxymethyltransferase